MRTPPDVVRSSLVPLFEAMLEVFNTKVFELIRRIIFFFYSFDIVRSLSFEVSIYFSK